MEASLESESTRQKRQQEYGYDPRAGSRAVSSDVDVCQGDAKGQSRVKCRERSDEAGQEEAAGREQTQVERMTKRKGGGRATYKRSRMQKRSFQCVSLSDKENGDYICKKKEEEADSFPLQCHINTPISSRLRDRKILKKPINKFSEMILYSKPTNANPKKRPKACKRMKEDSWWETANAVGIFSDFFSLFLFTLAGISYLACHAALSGCDQCRVT